MRLYLLLFDGENRQIPVGGRSIRVKHLSLLLPDLC